MSYLYRSGNGRNNIAYTTTANSSTKYLRRTSSGRNNITWTTIPQGSTYNILQRNGTGRTNILWANLRIGPTLSSLSIGTVVHIKENGTFTDFIILNTNYPQSGRIFLCRFGPYSANSVQWRSGVDPYGDRNNEYSGSTIDQWANNTYYNMLDTNVRSNITNVTIQYTIGNGGGLGTLNRRIFMLSTTEIGATSEHIEGSKAPYFNNHNISDMTIGHLVLLRSARDSDYWIYYINRDGEVKSSIGAGTYGSPLPAFTLPASMPIDSSNNIT